MCCWVAGFILRSLLTDSTLSRHISEKISPLLYGPFVIMEGIGAVAYRLRCLKRVRFKLFSMLASSKKQYLVPTIYQLQPLVAALTDKWELQPEIHDANYLHYNNSGSAEVLVKWKDCPNCDNSREAFEALQQSFPLFPFEYKVKAQAGVLIDTT